MIAMIEADHHEAQGRDLVGVEREIEEAGPRHDHGDHDRADHHAEVAPDAAQDEDREADEGEDRLEVGGEEVVEKSV